MSNWLNPDNKFFTFMGKAFDVVVLNTIWLILCIPIVTIVPATTALYYAMVKVIRRERSYATKEFFRSFKRNFRQGSLFSLLAIVLAFIMYIDFRYAWELIQAQNSSGSTYFGVFLVITFLFCAMYAYICPVLSRFDMKFSGILKTAFVMAARHIITTFLLLVLFVGVMLGCYILLPGIFFLPAIGILLSSFLIERIFKKYMPAKEESAEGEEERQEKDEWYLE